MHPNKVSGASNGSGNTYHVHYFGKLLSLLSEEINILET